MHMKIDYDEVCKHLFLAELSRMRSTKGKLFRQIYLRFYDGQGISKNRFSALVRPFRISIDKGTPIKKVSFVAHKNNEDYFILGTFTCTNKRILFFPGMNLFLSTPPDYYLERKKLDFFVDHLSLDRNLLSYHQTDLSKKTSKQKLYSQRTKKLTDDLYLWFVWCVKPTVLEKLPSVLSIIITGTENEIKHKSWVIMNACQVGRIATTETNDNIDGSHYWNFEFFVHKKNVDSDPELTKFGIHPSFFAYFPPIVKENREMVQARIYPIHLDGFEGTIFIRVSKLKGSFPSDTLMSSGKDFVQGQ